MMFRIKMELVICAFLVIGFLLGVHSHEEGENFCEGKAHYNSLSITCCASKKYASVIPNIFSNDDAMNGCSNEKDIMSTEKLTTKSWMLYSCLLRKKIKADISLKSFTEFMVKRFPDNVQKEIEKSLVKLKMSLPQEPIYQRKKRNLRFKRDGEEDPGVTDGATQPTEGGTKPTDSATEPTEGGTKPTDGATEPTEGGTKPTDSATEPTEGGTKPTDGATESTEGGTKPTDGATESTEGGTKPNDGVTESTEGGTKPTDGVTEPDKAGTGTTSTPPYTKASIYNYLSVFDYKDRFQYQISEEMKTLLRIWDAYYIAEFEACQILNGSDFYKIASYGTNRCFSWIMRTARGGECCGPAPIPIPLLNDPSLEMDAIHNTTAQKIFNLAGTYTWTNYSFSTNIMRCNRLATAILLNQVTTDNLKRDMDNYITSNLTTQPNYKGIAESLVPLHFPKSLKEQIVKEILPVKDPEDTKDADEKEELEKQQFRRLDKDSDLQIISNVNYTIYHWAAPHEWDKIDDDNKVRYVLWTCDAYRMISQRIKYFDTTPYCY